MSKERDRDNNNNSNTKGLIEIPPQNISKSKLIGNGGFGEVFLGKWDGIEIAIKQLHLKRLSPTLYQDFLNEAEILAKCRHPAIVTFFGISTQENCYQLILEFMHRGSLYDNLANHDLEMPMAPLRLEISLDIARGLRYLHQINIIHKDIKSMNILVSNDWKAKISDFGLAKIKVATEVSSTSTKRATSTRWCAPEVFKRNAIRTKESDIWSFGMVLWEIVSRKLPFVEETNEVIVMGFIKDGEKETIPNDCPDFLSDIIKQCWETDPTKRLEASKIVELLEPKVEEANKILAKSKEEKVLVKQFEKLEITDPKVQAIIGEFTSESLIFIEYKGILKNTTVEMSDDKKRVSRIGGNALTNKSFSTGKHKWMVTIEDKKSSVVVGIVTKGSEEKPLGMDSTGWGFIVYTHHLASYTNSNDDIHYGHQLGFQKGDMIGVLLDCDKGEISCVRNGKYLGVAFSNIPKGKEYIPAIYFSDKATVSFVDW